MARESVRRTNLPQRASLGVIRLYQLTLRSFVGQSCRFAPSCSEYAAGAVSQHGAWRGWLLAARRLSRCHPWHPGGFDPVPDRRA